VKSLGALSGAEISKDIKYACLEWCKKLKKDEEIRLRTRERRKENL
jgi:hypothetical protein